MLSETVKYKDFNGDPCVETLHFNLTYDNLTDNLDLIAQYRDIERRLGGVTRELEPHEVSEVLQFVKRFLRLSYGIKSDDGKKHRKNDEIWEDFQSSAVYDTFLWSLFQDLNKLDKFLSGILPEELIQRAQEEIERRRAAGELTPELQAAAPVLEKTPDTSDDVEDTRPAYQRENREPTQKELSAMSREEMQEAFRWKASR